MTFKLVATLRTARLALIAVALDAGASPGSIELYSGTQPVVEGDAITTQVLQCTVPLTDPSAVAAATVLTFGVAADGIRVAGDPITWARFVDSNGVCVMDADVTVTGGGGAVTISAVSGSPGAFVRITSGSLTE